MSGPFVADPTAGHVATFYTEAHPDGPVEWMAVELPAIGFTLDAPPTVDDAGTATAAGTWSGRPVRCRCRDVADRLQALIVSGLRTGDAGVADLGEICDNLQPLSAWLSASPGSTETALAEAERLAGPILNGELDRLVHGPYPLVYLNRLDAALVNVADLAGSVYKTRYGVVFIRA